MCSACCATDGEVSVLGSMVSLCSSGSMVQVCASDHDALLRGVEAPRMLKLDSDVDDKVSKSKIHAFETCIEIGL